MWNGPTSGPGAAADVDDPQFLAAAEAAESDAIVAAELPATMSSTSVVRCVVASGSISPVWPSSSTIMLLTVSASRLPNAKARSNAASLACDGLLKPLNLRTNCNAEAWISSSVAGGSTGAYIVIYKSTGTDATSALLLYLDTFTSGMPVVTNGGNITIQWDNGTNKIFKL